MESIKRRVPVSIAFVACFLFRLLPWRPPNVEPLLAVQMPASSAFGRWTGFFFGFLSIALFDVVTGHLGIWTLITGLCYGAIGLAAHWYFATRAASARSYATFAAMAVIAYDALTGLTIGPLFFHVPFAVALAGQIPFTILHLAGSVTFAYFLSPIIHWAFVHRRATSDGPAVVPALTSDNFANP